MKKRIALIGLGKQNTKDHLIAIQASKDVNLVAICDASKALREAWSKKLAVPAFKTVDALLAKIEIDAAVVAVPHFAYLAIIKSLAEHKVDILKEKPLAMSFEEAVAIAKIVEEKGINLTVAVQRKHNKIFKTYMDYASRIGDVFSIHGHYTLNIPQLDGDWRRSKELAGGGAVLDMGYHLLDLVVWYFGIPERVSAELGYNNRAQQDYDVEDTAKIQFSYKVRNRRILGSILLSRIYPEKAESITMYGTKGTVVISKDKIELCNLDKELMESMYLKSNGDDIQTQFNAFMNSLDGKGSGNYQEHLQNMVLIDAIYRSDMEGKTVKPHEDLKYLGFKLAPLPAVIAGTNA
jgi:predicted dehydrogenase